MTIASKQTRYIAKRRAQARAGGFCITCLRARVPEGRRVCYACTDSAFRRTLKRRAVLRQRVELQQLIEGHERAGDRASEHHLYADAVQWYRKGLDMEALVPIDRLRITAKLALVHFLSDNPSAATPLVDWLAKTHLLSGDRKETITYLRWLALQLWINAKTEQALPVLEEALKVSNAAGSPQLTVAVNLSRIRFLHILERNDEARQLLGTITESADWDHSYLYVAYYQELGVALARLGNLTSAHKNFESALALAKKSNDPFYLTVVWMNYSTSAKMFGDIDLAKSCIESALFLARQQQLTWRIPYFCVAYAQLLAIVGRYPAAREYILEALAYKAQVPILQEVISAVGIPLALSLKDTVLLERCEQPSTIRLSIQSGIPGDIGFVSAAFAELYAFRGEHSRARTLLHQALRYVRDIGEGCELSIAVARYGNRSDIPIARQILERRMALPSSDVAKAFLHLFDAFVAKRTQKLKEAHTYAGSAQRKFEALRWFGYAQVAQSLLVPDLKRPSVPEPMTKSFGHMQALLTAREQQVAELVLRGFTNRAIANELAISENTVETHMASIMNQMGIHSRHQLADVFSHLPE